MKGSVREREPGSNVWEVRVDHGLDPVTGKRRQKSRTVRGPRREAEKVKRQMLTEVDEDRHRSTDATVADLMGAWLDQAEENLSPTTHRRYEGIVANQVIPGLGKRSLRKLTSADLDVFYRQLRKSGLAPATVRQVHAVLHRALVQARRWGWVAANAADLASPPRVLRADVNAPEPDDVLRILAAAEKTDPAWATFLLLDAVTGARRGELCALRWNRVDWERRTLTISKAVIAVPGKQLVEKDTKSHAARTIALDEMAMVALRRHHTAMQDRAPGPLRSAAFMFTADLDGARPWHPDTATRRFRELRDALGLDGVRLHDLRHFVATRLLGAGMDVGTVADRLGHRDASVTLTVYRHFLEANDRQAAELMGGLLARPALDSAARVDAAVEVSRRSAAMVEGLRSATNLGGRVTDEEPPITRRCVT